MTFSNKVSGVFFLPSPKTLPVWVTALRIATNAQLCDGFDFFVLFIQAHLQGQGMRFLKILMHHPDLDVKPLFTYDLKLFPVVVSWFGRAEACR
jgi:hypothetical protein